MTNQPNIVDRPQLSAPKGKARTMEWKCYGCGQRYDLPPEMLEKEKTYHAECVSDL